MAEDSPPASEIGLDLREISKENPSSNLGTTIIINPPIKMTLSEQPVDPDSGLRSLKNNLAVNFAARKIWAMHLAQKYKPELMGMAIAAVISTGNNILGNPFSPESLSRVAALGIGSLSARHGSGVGSRVIGLAAGVGTALVGTELAEKITGPTYSGVAGSLDDPLTAGLSGAVATKATEFASAAKQASKKAVQKVAPLRK